MTLAPRPWVTFSKSEPRHGLFNGEDLPGKHEVAYRSWVFDVHSALHKFAEPPIWQSVYKSICGPAKRLIWCLGPSATVHYYIMRLDYHFGVVAGFDVLTQQFYQITQNKGEKVRNFTTHINITLDKNRVQFLNLINKAKKGWLLKDHYFYGMSKSLRGSVCYLYNNEAVTH